MKNFEEKKELAQEKGFRAQVVGCIVCEKMVYFFHDQRFDLWQFPQGGVGKGESPKDALVRELKEEIGVDFSDADFEFLTEDEIEFSRPHEKDGKTIAGKWYLIYAVFVKEKLKFSEEEFDEHRLLRYDEALELTEKIYQLNKKKMLQNILKRLKEKKTIL